MSLGNLLAQWKEISFWGNTLYTYAQSVLIFLCALIILMIFQRAVLMRLQKIAQQTKTDLDDVSLAIFTKIRPPFYLFISLYVAHRTLTLSKLSESVFKVAFILVIFY